MRLYYSRCDAVVVPSRAVAELLRSYGIKTDIEVIKSGVTASTSNHNQDVRESFGIARGDFLLLYVGRVAKEKNLSLLIKAFELVRAKHDKARLMVVGSGPDQAASEKLAASLGLSDTVKFTGMLSRDTVAGIYSAADAFVFPSTTETQGLVVCEALTTGLPCVAVRAAATPEVLEEGVDSLLTENTETAFAEATGRLIADPELRARLSEGALRNAPQFSIAAMAEHFEKFYQSVIDGKRG
jgi:glycosyltransferase involved in cell wall biosynthesis